MEVLHEFNERQLSNRTVSSPTRQRAALGTSDIRLRITIVSLTAGAELRVALSWTMPDGTTGQTVGVFRDVGNHELGFWRGQPASGDVALGGAIEIIGTVRFSGSIVAVDQGEDVL